MSEGLAAGPFGNPMRYVFGENEKEINMRWQRTIDKINSVYTVVMESSLNQSVTWFS